MHTWNLVFEFSSCNLSKYVLWINHSFLLVFQLLTVLQISLFCGCLFWKPEKKATEIPLAVSYLLSISLLMCFFCLRMTGQSGFVTFNSCMTIAHHATLFHWTCSPPAVLPGSLGSSLMGSTSSLCLQDVSFSSFLFSFLKIFSPCG